MKEYFLDYNAHTNMSKAALEAYIKYNSLSCAKAHPSSKTILGQQASGHIESARNKIAELLGAEKSSQIIFTSTCTQACEWALNICFKQSNNFNYFPLEHKAVYDYIKNKNLNKLELNNINFKEFNICCFMQPETGTIQNIKNNSGFLFSDMCQAVGKINFKLKDLPVDLAVFGAHKFGGPASLGILYLKNIKLLEKFGTGSQYYNDRPGTPDVAAIVSTVSALEDVLLNSSQKINNMISFRKKIDEMLENENHQVICRDEERINTSLINVNNSSAILNELGSQGIYLGAGSACNRNSEPSRVIEEYKLNKKELLRISTNGDYGEKESEDIGFKIIKSIRKFGG